MDAIKSAIIWFCNLMLSLIWLPLTAITRLFDRDPAHYRTGRLFRALGKAYSLINPDWNITITGRTDIDDRNPYVMVCNHQSLADIPLISNLPWEMKWIAKDALFKVPITGWMMRLAGDIAVKRKTADQKEFIFERAAFYLQNKCSVIFFPEGTRSKTGKLRRFTNGAFELAIKEQIPVLPMVIDGTQNTLPRDTWKFGKAENIRLKILDPIDTKALNEDHVGELMHNVRSLIEGQLIAWRSGEVENSY